MFALSVAGTGDGSGAIVATPTGINCTVAAGTATGTCVASYRRGTAVTLTATATDGKFAGWFGGCGGTGTCRLTVDRTRAVVASFVVPPVTLTVGSGVGNPGIGSVVSSPAGINCSISANLSTRDCVASFARNTRVTLTATPAPGFAFTGFDQDCAGSLSCTLSMSRAQIVGAIFTPLIALTVSSSGTGHGIVTSSPAGISCTITGAATSGTCSQSYLYGTVVTLTAAPVANHGFDGWSGACSGTGACSVTLVQARTVSAAFTAP